MPDKQSWDTAIVFMESMIRQRLKEIQEQITEFRGPSLTERWLHWKSTTPEQHTRSATINELEKLTKSFDVEKKDFVFFF